VSSVTLALWILQITKMCKIKFSSRYIRETFSALLSAVVEASEQNTENPNKWYLKRKLRCK